MTGKNSGLSEIYGRWNSAVNRAFKNKSPKERLIIFASHATALLTAMLFSIKSLPLTSLSVGVPLADAFLCSVTRYVPSAYLGAILGARASGAGITRYLMLTAIFILRTAVSAFLYGKRYRESILLRLGYCAVLSFSQCILFTMSNGVDSELALRVLGTLLSAPMICLIMSYYFASELKSAITGSMILKVLHLTSALFVFSSVVWCAKDLRFAGGSLTCMLAIFLTLISSKRGGILVGGLTGAILGYLYSPLYAVSTAVIGISAGVFFFLGALPASGISAVIGCFTAFKTVGYTALISFVPECVLALAIASPVIRYSFHSEAFPFLFGMKAPRNDGITSTFNAESEERYGRLMRLSDALRELSGSLAVYNRSNEKADELCSTVCHKFCDSCPVSPICWESERKRTSECIKTMISAFTGDANAEKAPKYLSEHCIKFKELTAEIEYGCKNLGRSQKTRESLGMPEYASFSAILSDIAEEERASLCDDTFYETVLKAAEKLGIPGDNVTLNGGKSKKVYLRYVETDTAENMATALEKAVGSKFKVTCPHVGYFVIEQSEMFKADAAFARLTKSGETHSGDATLAFSDTSGRYFAVLTDGMGSGEEAASCSSIAASLLEKLLRCGVRKSLAVEMLGDVLRKREGECFCTVDILEADLVNGNASFLKCGAAASYILRRGSVHAVSACSMPVGITERVTPEEMSFTLSEGDIAVMVSDGVAAEPSDGSIFTDILTAGAFLSIDELAEKILARALKRNGRNDDMTVTVVEISKAENKQEKKTS